MKKFNQQEFIIKINELFHGEVTCLRLPKNYQTKGLFQEPDLNNPGKFVTWESWPRNLLNGFRSIHNRALRSTSPFFTRITDVELLKVVQQCNTLKELRNFNGTNAYYEKFRKHRHKDEMGKHLSKSVRIFDRTQTHVIYSYTFSDGMIYIGQTCRLKSRKKEHKRLGPVYNHSVMLNEKPIFTILESNVSVALVGETEKKWQDTIELKYRLYKAKPGGLGSLDSTYWNKEKCKFYYNQVTNTAALLKLNKKCHDAAWVHGWHAELSAHFVRQKKSWTKEKAIEESKIYTKVLELRRKNESLYNAIVGRKWQHECFAHIPLSKYYKEDVKK